MNKLEEQIEEQKPISTKFNIGYETGFDANAFKDGFDSGAQFVIDLELDIKFAEWMGLNFTFDGVYWSPKGHLSNEIEVIKSYGNGTTFELRKFWIENIYGR